MQERDSAPRHAAQALDRFAEMLHANEVPPLQAVLMIEALEVPSRQLGPPEGVICKSNGALAARKRWPKGVLALAEKYPDYQPGHDMRERMKYGDMPDKNAQLIDFVLKRLNHARAVWSAEIDLKQTRLQFYEWLPEHVDFRTLARPFWTDGYHDPNDGWALSLQFLRVACGFPGFVATHLGASR